MDRISKLAILGWAIAALFVECYYISGAWHDALVFGPVIFGSCALAAYFDRRAIAPIAAAAYIFPILILEANGLVYHVHYSTVWLAGLLGVITPDALRTGWRLPERWRAPLACWAVGVLATAPIIALRAVDFQTELLFRPRLATEALGGLPLLTITWTIHVALLLAVGVLWFDWLCDRDQTFFERWVAVPLALSAAVLGGVACYQLFVDVHFLNLSVYGNLGRASGTMFDSNVTGAIAAAWIGGAAMLSIRTAGLRRVLGVALIVVLWLAVWATGSRTAFASAAITSIVSVAGMMRGRVSSTTAVAAGVLALLVAGVTYAAVSRSGNRIVGPLSRIQAMVPDRSPAGLKSTALELWNRNGYGLAATRMIEAYPAFGVGIGAFHEMAGEFVGAIPPDNAQSWYRHQVVELGIVGSLGAILFVGSFGWWVVRRHESERVPASPVRGAILGLATVSWLGMPGQDPAVAFTFWTFAAWFLMVSGRPRDSVPTPRAAWVAAAAVGLVFAAGTAQLAVGRLRLPVRIQRTGGEYLYGFSWPEPDGEGGEYRWARRKSTAVIPAPTRSLELTLRVNHLDLAEHPTHARAWVDGKLVVDTTLTEGADTIKKAMMLPEGEQRALIETWADHAVSAPAGDGRELALMVRWRFVPSSR